MGNLVSISTSTNDMLLALAIFVGYICLTRYLRAYDAIWEEIHREKENKESDQS
jgi:hypothetical protein